MKKLSYLLMFLLILSSCSNEIEIKTLSLSATSAEYDYEGTINDSFGITSNMKWTVTSDSDWLKIITKEGENNGEVYYECIRSTTGSDRYAKIEIKGEDNQTGLFSVFQKAFPLYLTWENYISNGIEYFDFRENGSLYYSEFDTNSNTWIVQNLYLTYDLTETIITIHNGNTDFLYEYRFSQDESKLYLTGEDGTTYVLE